MVFLGKLADLAGDSQREFSGPLDWAALLAALGPDLAEAVRGERVKLALDGKVLADRTGLEALDGSEIALLPPVSGG